MALKVYLKGGYSDRNKFVVYNEVAQYQYLNERTRNKLYMKWVKYLELSSRRFSSDYNLKNSNRFIEYIYLELFSLTIDDIPTSFNGAVIYKIKHTIKDFILEADFNQVFDFLEGTNNFFKSYSLTDVEKDTNILFETEQVGHRFLDGKIIDITDKAEVEEIQECLDNDDKVSKHINQAIILLYNREHPDYANSIKESITAVEAACNILLETEKCTLGAALKKLEDKGIVIHPALKQAFDKLYGYTSDAGGIRHSGDLGTNATREEAKFMLVACSAFCNYLKTFR